MRTLLLTTSYEPVQVIAWQRAISLIALDKVDVVSAYEDAVVRGPSACVQVPSVVRLRRSFRRHAAPVRFSRANIYARDGHRCQYCGKPCAPNELTYDHVVPRSRGGRTSWENIVSACCACNALKANRTPAEARMALRSVPARPTWLPSVQIQISARSVPDAWRDYLYWTQEIET